MARLSTAQWGYISGDVSSFAYRPLFGKDDVVYKKDEYTQAASSKHTSFTHRPYKIIHGGIRVNAAGAPLKNSDDTAIVGAVGAQADAPWVYDIQEIKAGETVATASGVIQRDVKESNLASLADIKTYVTSELADWADPAA